MIDLGNGAGNEISDIHADIDPHPYPHLDSDIWNLVKMGVEIDI